MRYLGLLLFCGCNFSSNMATVTDVGIMICKSAIPEQPIYSIDTGAATTKFVQGIGVPSYVEFIDIDTKEVIRLGDTAKSQLYECESERV